MKNALLIVDMQKDFVYPGSPAAVAGAFSTLGDLQKILGIFRDRSELVIHVIREYRADGSDIEKFRLDAFRKEPWCVKGKEGSQIVDELKPVPGELVLVKNRFSGFMNTELDLILRRNKVGRVYIAGTQYPNCIRATAFDALCLDYEVTVVLEGTSAATPEVAQANIRDMKNVGVKFVSMKEL